MKPALERQIEDAICVFLEMNRWFVQKIEQSGYYDAKRGHFRKRRSRWARPGFPDLFCAKEGQVMLLEVKTKRGTLSSYQKELIPRLSSAGVRVHVVRSVDDVKELM